MTTIKENNKIALELFSMILKNNYLEDFSFHQTSQLWELCHNLVFLDDYQVELVVGIGGSEDDVSTRFMSYIIPTLELAYLFYSFFHDRKIKSLPYLRIISALQASLLINKKYKSELILRNGEHRNTVMQEFLNFYPVMFKKIISIEDDFDFTYPNLKNINPLFNYLESNNSERITKGLETLKGWAGKRIFNDSTNELENRSQQYAFYHLYFFHDVIDPKVNPYQRHPDCVISIGGFAEKTFNIFRSNLVGLVKGENIWRPKTIKLIQKAGKYPPYYLFPNDILIADWNKEPLISKHLAQIKRDDKNKKSFVTDLETILHFFQDYLKATNPEESYREFCHKVAKIIKK